MNKLSVLQKEPTVYADPYPHILIEDALPWDIYEELSDTHMCGLCYTYIWKRDIAKHIKQ